MATPATCNRFFLLVAVGLGIPARAFGQPTASCVVADATAPTKDSLVFEAASGGSPIAKFTGAMIPVRLGEMPASFAGGRLRVETGDGKTPYVRVRGFVEPAAFRFFARRSVPLVQGHVWLPKGLEIKPVAGNGERLEFEHVLLGARGADGGPRKLRGSIACSDIALAPPGLEAVEIPKGARWYHMKRDVLTLHDAPKGTPVFELRMDEQARKVAWSTEMKAGWLHVVALGDVTLDGWVKPADLEPQLHGEVIDMDSLAPAPLAPASVALASPPKTLTATLELSLLPRPDVAASPFGVLDVGATFHTMAVSTAWTSVLSTDLAITAPDGGGFWVKTSSLPKP